MGKDQRRKHHGFDVRRNRKLRAEKAKLEGVPVEDIDVALSALADDSGYAPDDPKHPDFHDTMSDLWDSREGK